MPPLTSENNTHKGLQVLVAHLPNVVDDDCIVMPGQLGLSEQAFDHLGVAESSNVRVNHAEPPLSMEFVREKLSGERITQDKFHHIIQDIAQNRYSKPEIAAFLVAVSEAGLDRDEVLYLTRAMVESGQKLDWEEKLRKYWFASSQASVR